MCLFACYFFKLVVLSVIYMVTLLGFRQGLFSTLGLGKCVCCSVVCLLQLC